jgi:hypothetical protein
MTFRLNEANDEPFPPVTRENTGKTDGKKDEMNQTVHPTPGYDRYWWHITFKALWRWIIRTIADAWNRRNNL